MNQSTNQPAGASRLIILRHGETDWNAEGRFQGQADIPLNERGLAQAAAAGAVLAKEPVSRIVASDLSRAMTTAQALAELVGLEITPDRRLREIDMGSWEGELFRGFPGYDGSAHPDDVRRSATGEHTREVGERCAAALREHVAATEDGGLLVAAMHGVAGRAAMGAFLGMPFEQWRLFSGMVNCGWIELHQRHGAWRIAAYNRTA